jgi:hypothetical protein
MNSNVKLLSTEPLKVYGNTLNYRYDLSDPPKPHRCEMCGRLDYLNLWTEETELPDTHEIKISIPRGTRSAGKIVVCDVCYEEQKRRRKLVLKITDTTI